MKEIKVLESLFGLQLDPDSRAVRCPHGLRLRYLPLQSAGLRARLRRRARGPAAQPGLRQTRRGQNLSCAGEGVAGAGAGASSPASG